MKLNANSNASFSNEVIEGIPVLVCSDESNNPKPLIIFSHGFLCKKEDWKEYMKEAAEMGYYSVALDNRLHGERKGFDSVTSEEGIDFYEICRTIKDNADDITVLIDYFYTKTEIDKDRIGMVGVSMGGFTTYRAVVIDKRIKVAIPIISSPVWEDIPGDYYADNNPEIYNKLFSFGKQYAPSSFVGKFHPTALLMQVGSEDKHFNVEKLKLFEQNVKGYYKDDLSKFELIVFDGIGHEFTEEMWNNAKAWLSKYL